MSEKMYYGYYNLDLFPCSLSYYRDLHGRLGLLKQGVTIFTITYSYIINDLNAEKNSAQW